MKKISLFAKMQRRVRRSKTPSSPLRWLWWLTGLILVSSVVLMLLAPTLVTNYLRAYLRQSGFHQKIEGKITAKFGGSARIAPLLWSDDTAGVADLSVATASGWNVEAGGIHLSLDFGAIRQGSWSIQNAGADDLTLRLSAGDGAALFDSPADDSSDDAVPAFLRRYIPAKTEVSGFDVQRFFLEQGGWKIADTRLHMGEWRSGESSVAIKLNGGSLQTPLNAPQQKESLKLDLTQASLRAGTGQLQLSNATLRWKQGTEITLRVAWKFDTGAWQTFTHVKGAPLGEFLDVAWKQRLSGKIDGDVEATGSRGRPTVWKANAMLQGGVLQGLPILAKLVEYTKVPRFNRIVLDVCSASFRPQGDALHVENIVVESKGLLRIEGSMTIIGRAVEGNFMLGVTPETLRAIPGANNRVFVGINPSGPPGLQWTRVHIAGTLDSPKEDLSSRLVGAAGMSLLFDAPGNLVNQGAETLLKPVLGEDAAKMPGKIIDGASGVIEGGVKAGTGIINKMLPIFPGK
jgi:hypothetical protein